MGESSFKEKQHVEDSEQVNANDVAVVEKEGKKKKRKNIFTLIIDFFKYIIKYWSVPEKGKYMPVKEIFYFCLGGVGVFAVILLPGFVTLDAGLYIAVALKVTPSQIAIITVINLVIGILKAPLIAAIVDNTKSKYGKFRPHLIWWPIPILVCFIAVGWLPYMVKYNLGSQIGMIVVYIIIFNILMFFISLYSLAFYTIPQIISPSTEERTTLMSVGAFCYSLGPSITNLFFPIFANLFFAHKAMSMIGMNENEIAIQGYNTIEAYRILLPIFVLVFLLVGYFMAFGIKERMVLPKKKVLKVKFASGVKLTFENKYFWLYNLSQAAMALRILCQVVLSSWAATYIINTPSALGVINTILGTASVPGMLLAPLLIKKIGKKQLQIWSNLGASIVALIVLLMALKPAGGDGNFEIWQGYVMVVAGYITLLLCSVQVVTNPAMVAQMYDYQQYKTGDRLEGFLSQFGSIIIQIAGIIPLIIKTLVLEKSGVQDDYSQLYKGSVFRKVALGLFVASIIGGVLTALPYFFWDLNENRHDRIMEILEVRAKKEDGEITEELAKEIETKLENGEKGVMEQYFSPAEQKK